MNDFNRCPNCGAEVKSGLISSNKILQEEKINIINEYHEKGSSAYCAKCGNSLYKKYVDSLIEERESLAQTIQGLLTHIPVISSHSPLNWDYDILGMVTGQSTSGTGFATEFTSSIADLLGTQSERHNKKIKEGEYSCFAQLRMQALDLGGNAIVATDIDYSEMGSMKGMIMVCMAGTAINLKNTSILGEAKEKGMERVISLSKKLTHLNRYKIIE